MLFGIGRVGLGLCLAVLGFAAPALADGPDQNGITAPSIATSLPDNGDPTGMRKWLASHGITYNFIYTNDLLANVSGGLRRGTVDQGKLEYNMTVDLEKLANWQGLSFYANVFQIHNTGRIRRDYVGGINTIAAIEAVPATRLSELWLEQKFWDGKASVRAGQLAADSEFFFSSLSFMFLQSDWATITAANLPSGGPAYPLSTPGVRFKADPNANVSLLLAVFNGDPAGPGNGDEQLRNRYGLNFRVRDPALVIAEAQFRANQGKDDTGLARALKLGAWGHFGDFNDLRFGNDGTLLGATAGTGVPATRQGNFGLYGVIEQQLYRPAGGAADSGVSVFSRVSFSPSDRNLIDFFVDGGLVFAGMVPGRPDDKFGASFMYARFSDSVRSFDLDRILSGTPGFVRDFEANLELSYSATMVPGWTMQPVLTYVWHPAGDASRNAIVTGVRSIWLF
ncbi:MAG: carbohydrate porin [Rhodopseudomonas sp.]|uniref:carbohydrate porin n=1 Tax=Rhodopseudomonas sp. TaxID=1078 RepID=UPI0018538CF1|nr:carbohydrate porin [Rhodopseudomonas sp.]NVN87781.1 carbohydrate porin [Rhodopseudomonas sp.]